MAMETITLDQLKQDILAEGRIPLNGSIELTFRCNLKCLFCYCHSTAVTKDDKELTTDELYSVIDEIAELGCLNLVISGGEPLIRKDFKEIYTYALQKGFLITLYSNGTIIDKKMADFFYDNRPQKIEITVYGIIKETYETITNVSGSYKRCMNGIRLLLDRKIPLELKTTVCNKNYHEVGMIRDFAEERGLIYRFDAMLDPQIDGNASVCQYRLNPEDIIALDQVDPDRSDNLKKLVERKRKVADPSLIYICGAGENSFHIDPYGKLSMCMLTRYDAYDLKKGTFKDGFYDFFSLLRCQRHDEGKIPACNNCQLINLCTNCPGTSRLETGSFEFPSDFHCRVARLRAKPFGT